MKKIGLVLLVTVVFLVQNCFSQDWVWLFNGNSLDGWKASENPGSFKLVDGQIVCAGERSHLFYVGKDGNADFKNFELELEYKSTQNANSGVFFHTIFQEKGFPSKGFEAQIHNTPKESAGYRENKLTGSLYGIRNVYKPIAKDDEWNKMRIIVQGKQVKIFINEINTVDYVEPLEPPTISGRPGRKIDHGTFALQCHDPESKVYFKNIRVKRLPDNLQSERKPKEKFSDYELEIVRLGVANYPVVNLHTHLKGGLTLDEALEESRSNGVFLGIAVNCGIGFPITNDAGIKSFVEQMKGKAAFFAMQAEGREWVKLFSKDAIKQFDYVFTDSMTIVDDNGKRMRLWIPQEVGEIKDKEAFMEMLVDRAVKILSTEPIDIYVNPTFLPDQISSEYDKLWTEERMQKVINAAAKNGIAIEINGRLKLPSLKFIKLAKKTGCKFTMGTNNADRNIGDLNYCFQMIKEAGLKWQDFWLPTLKKNKI